MASRAVAALRRHAAIALVVALGVAYAWEIQQPGWAASSHYALVRALADGTARIDAWHAETGDKSWFEGHYYSVKAPGLAALSLPAYLVVERIPPIAEDRDRTVWALNLWACALPALVLVLLVLHAAGRFDRDTRAVAAVAVGAGSLVLPFATMYFSHVTAAAIGFAAFAVLLRERDGPARPRLVFAGGALAGASILFEYPMGLVAVALGVYAAARTRWARRALVYAGGVGAALLPLAAYNRWAFGSVTHLSYEDAVITQGRTGHDVLGANSEGLYGVTVPSPGAFVQILLDDRGLLTLTPAAAAGAVGIVLLYRAGRRAEALLCGGLSAAFLVYNAGYTTSFGGVYGGNTPGPRFLIGALPFLLAPIGLAWRRAPAVVSALVVASAATMTAATLTNPRIGDGETHVWWDAFRELNFTDTLFTEAGGADGLLSALPALLAVAAALVVAAGAVRRPPLGVRSLATGAAALAAWAAVLAAAPVFVEDGGAELVVAAAVGCLGLLVGGLAARAEPA